MAVDKVTVVPEILATVAVEGTPSATTFIPATTPVTVFGIVNAVDAEVAVPVVVTAPLTLVIKNAFGLDALYFIAWLSDQNNNVAG